MLSPFFSTKVLVLVGNYDEALKNSKKIRDLGA